MVDVIKANGVIEPFSDEKVRGSILRAGIKKELADEVLGHVKGKLYNNIPTSEIYTHITEYLGATPGKAKYSLKRAIMELGPTGYPFEDFISEILKMEGYKTEVGSILTGKCVQHEVDVIAEKNGKKIMVEAKFHNDVGIKTELHVSMYTKARFDDVSDRYGLDQAWIVTNTKVSIDALSFAKCSGMKILSWSYPENEGLRDLVEKWKLHPVTALLTLSQSQKQILLENRVVLCKNICENSSILDLLNIPHNKKEEIVNEAKLICNGQNHP
ncbi:MAG: ATPase [Candidatus Levybacteria bacterium CG_4_9_14_3_um_filter_35_16]|nr:MAG: ATPase [Candidatus Levybacteria bacterium CG22_combo_CG10-13_8_21_14_all_35_11]PIY94034.1 MAG: ATPase [Candidatus Levybacteria bacterium CG_4_10_14_0_8_um_filter_35_23]PJA91636.1 MAG: ATPase [Candidatus Levybacteria bacterium CG_4_9_14_3_um_filter_35_16]PJC54635.1 MAG: ATPase [Candidatus Levybacteria bacterium CG_4_9_14_0_2_um_filter_35_21]